MSRVVDLLVSGILIIALFIPMLFICVIIRLTSSGPCIHWSDRVGLDNRLYRMPKFRTMFTDVPIVATHLLDDPDRYVTSVGKILRLTSLDELPQLWSVFMGDMALVGPRPALFNQKCLIQLRTENGVHKLLPGITGWAQVNGRDELTVEEKVFFDVEYLKRRSVLFDFSIILLTIKRVLKSEGVTH